MGDTSRVATVAVGVVTLHFKGGKFLVLDDCLFVPGVRRNLVSVFYLSCNGYSSVFNKDSVFVKYNDDIVGSGAAERLCELERTREGVTMGNFNFHYIIQPYGDY